MPRDLFQPTAASSTPLGRRAGLVPLSIAAHAVAIGAAVLVPAFAVGALPDPRVSLTYNVHPTIVPVVPALRPPARPRPAMSGGAPLVTPNALPDRDALPAVALGRVTPGMDDGLPWRDGVPAGIDGDVGTAVADLPPPPAPPRLARVGGDVRPPVKIHDAAPVYPALARSARVQGVVIVEATIDESGRVVHARLLRSIPLLDEAALAAVREWTFTPSRLNGEPTSILMTVTVQFRLE